MRFHFMMSFKKPSLLLATLLFIGTVSSFVSQDEVDSMWQEAESCYQEQLRNNTIHGGTSRSRRSINMTPDAEVISANNNIYGIYEKMMMHKHNVTKRQVANTQTPAACRVPPANCNGAATARYRNIDGTCNNLENPLWGTTNRPFNRVARNAYQDGFEVPRGGWNSNLPNTRVISTQVHLFSNPVNREVTNMVPQFGQFLDHDITLTPNTDAQCCRNSRNDFNCWAIPIPQNDQFYSRLRTPQRCMDFTRSSTCSASGVREQVNAITSYIDGSMVYGSHLNRTRQLRSFRGGRLATNNDRSLNGFLPSGNQRGVQVTGTFVAGDDRINAMPGLAVMHNLFLMEHNRIASELQRLSGSNNDEVLFQEARRILIAILQNIVYNEFLPVILGDEAMNEYSLNLPSEGHTEYNRNTDPTIFNSFACAAFRFGHSMVAGLVRLIGPAPDNNVVGSYALRDVYFRSEQMTQSNGNGYHLILRSLMTQNAPEMDRHCTGEVTNFLFKPQNQNFGSDLIARNIQRGRDHGIPSYNVFRQLCGLPALTDWANRPAEIREDSWEAIRKVYSDNRNTPQDIDLFTGGTAEMPTNGGVTGRTFQCMNAAQFQRLMYGDRYFFTHHTGPYAFNPEQMREIRRQRLSDVVCRNSRQEDAPANAFLVTSDSNPMESCESREPLNLMAFLN